MHLHEGEEYHFKERNMVIRMMQVEERVHDHFNFTGSHLLQKTKMKLIFVDQEPGSCTSKAVFCQS